MEDGLDSTMTVSEQADVDKIRAEIAKLTAETVKIGMESRWYPVVIAGSIIAGTTAAILAVIGGVIGLFKVFGA